jgi:hypothetical protein
MDAVERRAEKRVRPPGDAVTDFALWPAELIPPSRLLPRELGPPVASRRAGDQLAISDVAAIGLGLHLCAAQDAAAGLSAVPALYLYLKLCDYRPLAPNGVLSLFFHAQIARAAVTPEGLDLGMRLLRQGRGSFFEKALELLDVSRFGVPELVVWIDAVVRGSKEKEPDRRLGPGLDLDLLLEEPELGPVPPDTQRNDL